MIETSGQVFMEVLAVTGLNSPMRPIGLNT